MTHCQFCGAVVQPSLTYCPSCGNAMVANNMQGGSATNTTGNPPHAMPMPQNGQPPTPVQPPSAMPSTLFKKPGQVFPLPTSPAAQNQPPAGPPSHSGLLGNTSLSRPHSLSGLQGPSSQFAPRLSLSGIPDTSSGSQAQRSPQSSLSGFQNGGFAAQPPSTPLPPQPLAAMPNTMQQAAGAPGIPMAALPNTPQPLAPASLWQPPRQPDMASRPATANQSKGRARIGVWLTIFILCALVVGTIGVFAYQKYSGNSRQGSPSFTSVQGPSGTSSVEQAASIILHAQTSSGIDTNYNPVNPGKNFAVGQKIYISFDIQAKTTRGYIEVRWYSGKHMKDNDTFAHDPTNSSGYFSTYYDAPAQGAAELYWCTRANCSDAQLAQVVTFSVASYQSNP